MNWNDLERNWLLCNSVSLDLGIKMGKKIGFAAASLYVFVGKNKNSL